MTVSDNGTSHLVQQRVQSTYRLCRLPNSPHMRTYVAAPPALTLDREPRKLVVAHTAVLDRVLVGEGRCRCLEKCLEPLRDKVLFEVENL